MVLDHCIHTGVPVALVLSGGYARNIEDTVDIQFTTARIAVEALLNRTVQ